jgi:hypothetical protein
LDQPSGLIGKVLKRTSQGGVSEDQLRLFKDRLAASEDGSMSLEDKLMA